MSPNSAARDAQDSAPEAVRPRRAGRDWGRRSVLGAGLAALSLTGLGGMFRAAPDPDTTVLADLAGVGGAPAGERWRGSYLQIIAHPDDDLYFMNPLLQRSIAEGSPVATAVLTAGEADGRNSPTDDDKEHAKTPADKPGYTEARHNGLRSAYALMATGNQQAAWRREVVTLGDGAQVERCTLAERPAVQLYFFNLAQNLHGSAKAPDGTGVRMRTLWSGDVPLESTLPGTGAPVTAPQDFSRDRVTACLLDLLKQRRPTVVRTLDPDPEHDPYQPGISLADHIDHTATAQFVLAALRTYTEETGARPVVEHFRGYTSKFWPSNLSAAAKAEKRSYLMPYAGFGAPCPANNCGDYQVRPDPGDSTHLISSAYRYTPATDWLVKDGTGRLNAFAVLGGRVVHWTEQAAGSGSWGEARQLTGDWLMPRLQVGVDRSGRIQLVALRRWAGDKDTVGAEVVRAVQTAPGGEFGAWESLEGPDYGNSDHRVRREIGAPAAAFDADGRLHVFVRNFAHGLSHRQELPGGGFGPWQKLGGSVLQDAVTAFTGHDGAVQVFATDTHGVLRWRQERAGGGFRTERIGIPVPVAGAVTPVESTPGRLTLYYREAGTANVVVYRQESDGVHWPPLPAVLSGHDGTGEIAAARWGSGRNGASSGTAVADRAGSGLLSLLVAAPGTPGIGWAESGGQLVYAPAMAEDSTGRMVAAVIGVDARLHTARQSSPESASPLGPWTTV
ncbi:PIG-L family deacetylase [Saccharothrix sp. ST-888]|uniref:PIG-L family deacetylase n=1 Tax=Saccharothrix sp. ST-888 TaxID=1427391 RepID=UPI0012E06F61|nr:PIG-L family deacetylase [Saccharothrix sp. ST-888]